MQFALISLFPEMFQSLEHSIPGRAIKKGLLKLAFYNPRDFSTDKHQSVDDHPYGGGPGMLMLAEPLHAAIQAAKKDLAPNTPVIYLSPQGRRFDQEAAIALAKLPAAILLCGRYEGIDERIIEQDVSEEWSLGDFILSGGELAAMAMIDATVRFIPGVLGESASVEQDSLSNGLLKYPQYSRPEIFHGESVPEVLLSGHHQKIAQWRLKASLGKTWLKRPDLLVNKSLNDEEICLLSEFIKEFLQ